MICVCATSCHVCSRDVRIVCPQLKHYTQSLVDRRSRTSTNRSWRRQPQNVFWVVITLPTFDILFLLDTSTAFSSSRISFSVLLMLWAGRSGVSTLVKGKNFFSSPNRPERLWVPLSLHYDGYRGSFSGVKWPGHKYDHSPRSSAEVKNEWSYTSAPPIRFHGVEKENFTFTCKTHVKAAAVPLQAWSGPEGSRKLRFQVIVRPKGLCHWKTPMTPSGIEPATCRFVA